MNLARILPYAFVLATTACAAPGTVVRAGQPKQVDLFQLCSDPRFECVPVAQPQQSVQPVRVDTNLATPHRASFSG